MGSLGRRRQDTQLITKKVRPLTASSRSVASGCIPEATQCFSAPALLAARHRPDRLARRMAFFVACTASVTWPE
jgi:hypothetical protein